MKFKLFKTNVKNFLDIDDDIIKLEKVIKERKQIKKTLTNEILGFMNTHNIEDLSTGNGKLKRSVEKRAKIDIIGPKCTEFYKH